MDYHCTFSFHRQDIWKHLKNNAIIVESRREESALSAEACVMFAGLMAFARSRAANERGGKLPNDAEHSEASIKKEELS